MGSLQWSFSELFILPKTVSGIICHLKDIENLLPLFQTEIILKRFFGRF